MNELKEKLQLIINWGKKLKVITKSEYTSTYPSDFIEELNKIPINEKVSVILPCYNEAQTIGRVLSTIESLNLPNYEIIVVDDCSKDNSIDIVKKYKNTKIICHSTNKGYGKTLLDGINGSTGDIIVTIDSDGQHDPLDIPILIEPVIKGYADIVVGSRYSGRYNYELPFTNRTGEALIEALLVFLFGTYVKNNQGGFRAFHRKTLDIFKEARFTDMAFTTEILMIGSIKGYKIDEKPINLRGREVGSSRVNKIKLLQDIIRSFTYYFLKSLLSKLTTKYPRFNEKLKKPIIHNLIYSFKKILLQ